MTYSSWISRILWICEFFVNFVSDLHVLIPKKRKNLFFSLKTQVLKHFNSLPLAHSTAQWNNQQVFVAFYGKVPGGQKMAQFFVVLTSLNIKWFSTLFHCQNQEKICNTSNTITKDPTTPQVCRYTINALFLVANLLTCVMCCYRSRLLFSCCF